MAQADPSTLIHTLLGALHVGALLTLLWRMHWVGRVIVVLILLPLLPFWLAWRGVRWLAGAARRDARYPRKT